MSRKMFLTCSLVGLGACAAPGSMIEIAVTPPEQLCAGENLPHGATCMPIAKLERLLTHGEMTLLRVKGTSTGTAGAKAMWVKFPKDSTTLKMKWKESARGGAALNNEPRKELAAYELQKLFLDPDEYVVPPTAARCIPLDLYENEVRHTKPTFPDTRCAFGVVSYWLQGMEVLKEIDATRFENDLLYRKAIVNLNVFTFLFDHRDPRPANFLITKSPDQTRAFAIDNGLALDGLTNPRAAFLKEWQQLRIKKLPHALVDRLRKITRADLDSLATVAELAIDGGQMDTIERTAAFSAGESIRRKGNVIQLGLTKSEIDSIEKRLAQILRLVDEGKLSSY